MLSAFFPLASSFQVSYILDVYVLQNKQHSIELKIIKY